MKHRPPSAAVIGFERPAWQIYGFAALMVSAALLVRWSLDRFAGDAVPLTTVYVAVAFAVWFGGWKSAAFVAVVGYLAALWCFLPPRYTFKLWETHGVLRTLLYFVSCSITIFLCETLRRAQRRHAVSEAKVVSILENMQECFLSVDADWQITAANAKAVASLGKTRDQMIGESLWNVLPKAFIHSNQERLRAARQGFPVQFETNTLVPGTWHTITASSALERVAIFFADISEKKAHVEQLERLVDDRTAALQRVISELEAFSYTLVHDMRAPLRSINGFAEILATDQAPHLSLEGRRYVERIQQSATRMDQLILDILNYSQLSRRKPEVRVLNLDDAMRELIRSDAGLTPDHADIAIEGTLPHVCGNEVLLAQCFSNLLRNAVKFVAPGVKPRVTISGRVTGGVARIDISDNGIGIAPEATVRIFDPFRREHPHYDGTGIGLAIVRKVVEQLDGRVGVDSDVGIGSRFWVELQTAPQSMEILSEQKAPSIFV